jgi:lysophospholipase L1-like esterase
MNTDPQAKRILCYGDSNTWGYIPGSGERFTADIRWTGQLQHILGNDYEVIEEGLNSRTTAIDDPTKEGKNGLTYLLPCLQSHSPIDTIVLMLGTNDLKQRFNRSPEEIGSSMNELLTLIRSDRWQEVEQNRPTILLVCPPLVDESVAGVQAKYAGAREKVEKLQDIYHNLATQHDCTFLALADHVQPSRVDGYHLDAEAHAVVANLVATALK